MTSITGSSNFPDGLLDASLTGQCSTDCNESVEVRRRVTINILPDDALLEIFHLCRGGLRWWWKALTDVCRRWRDVIFASPYGLDVRLECTERTPTRTSLDIWPPIPIAISCYSYLRLDDENRDNIIAALEHHDRIIQIQISIDGFKTFIAVTAERPFPVLTDLCLSSHNKIAPVLDEEFLGGCAPCLRRFHLENIAFPAFPKLALSATRLSSLTLLNIPITGYISPEAMAPCLATLPSLESFHIGFPIHSPSSLPKISLWGPPPNRTVLPALTLLFFVGDSTYLEDLVARIDTPQLNRLQIYLLMDHPIHIPQLCDFIARSESLRPFNPAKITFFSSGFKILLGSLTGVVDWLIPCGGPGRWASSMVQVCNELSPFLSHVEQLDIGEGMIEQSHRRNEIDSMQLFECFDHFSAVKYLHVYDGLRPLAVQGLQKLTGERATQIFPSLRSLVFKGSRLSKPVQEDIEPFIVARQHSNYPVNVHWE